MPKEIVGMRRFSSFSGADIVASLNVPGTKDHYVFAELESLTYSVHRYKGQVRSIGYANVRGFVMGTRTIAGSLTFAVFDRHVVKNVVSSMNSSLDSKFHGNFLMDEMPPFDISLYFYNEAGVKSRMAIYGVTIVDEGTALGISEIVPRTQMSYYARDIEQLDNF